MSRPIFILLILLILLLLLLGTTASVLSVCHAYIRMEGVGEDVHDLEGFVIGYCGIQLNI